MRRFFLVMLAAWATLAHADPAADLVAKLAQPGGRIVREFDPGMGLRGFVVQHAETKKSALLYVDPQGRFLLSGILFDAEGKNVSLEHADAFVPKPDAAAILKDAESTAWIEDGKAGAKAVLYVLGEPNCGYCKVFYAQTRDAVAKGDLALRWIMIGFDPAGKQKAAELYGAASPAKALHDLYANGPGASATRMPPPSGKTQIGPRPEHEGAPQSVARNEAYAAKHGIGGTPHIIYRTASGAVQTSPGVPQPKAFAEILAIASR